MPGGSVERLVNTVQPKTQKTPRISTDTRDQSLPGSKGQGAYYQCQQKTFVRKVPLPGCFSLPSFPLKRTLLLCELASEIPTVNPVANGSDHPNFQLQYHRSFSSCLTSPTARPPYSGGEELNSTEMLVISENVN